MIYAEVSKFLLLPILARQITPVKYWWFKIWCQNRCLRLQRALDVSNSIELDRVYLNSKTQQVLAIFPNLNPKNPISKDCQNPNSKKTRKLKLHQKSILYYRTFCQKRMHFRQILVKIFSQTSKLENSMSNEPIFLNPKTQTRKFLEFWNPEKFKPKPKRGN